MEILEICQMVARSLVAEIGPWGNHCAFFGGLSPGLLIPEPHAPLAKHIGTRDVDLAIRVATLDDDREMYRTLKQNLSSLGLQQSSDRSFEWHRTVEGFPVVVELFVPVADPSDAGRIQRKPIDQGGSTLTALGIYGLDLLPRDLVEVESEGPLLDGRGIRKTRLKVCGPAMLIALKAWALHERNKPKDGYDIVWLLRAYGADSLAERFKAAGLLDEEFGRGAIGHLREYFSSPQHTGPVGWISESGFQGEEAAIEARNAAGIVSEFLRLSSL